VRRLSCRTFCNEKHCFACDVRKFVFAFFLVS